MKFIRKAALCASLLLAVTQAQADVVWDWELVVPSATFDANAPVHARASITNDISSTETLYISSYGIAAPMLGGNYNFNYLAALGGNEPAQLQNFQQTMSLLYNVGLAPGQSHIFDFVTMTPQFAAAPGLYSVEAQIGRRDAESVFKSLEWQVGTAEVPEPGSLGLLFAGLVGLARRKAR